MRTKASLKGHPFHQMLIPFPIAFLVGAFIFDILGLLVSNQNFWITGAYLSIAGIIAGLIAAVPGFIDYLFTVPPESSGHKRATKHMLVNVSAVVIFLIVVLIRGPFESEPGFLVIILEIIALALLASGGWMGGTLVNRNFIGPDHRYAGAGKWKEETFYAKPGERVAVAGKDELKTDQMKLVKINGERIVLGKTEEGYFAIQDKCTHKGGSLAGGILICGTVQCLWHGSQFDVKSGEVKNGPAEEQVKIYKTEESGNEIKILI